MNVKKFVKSVVINAACYVIGVEIGRMIRARYLTYPKFDVTELDELFDQERLDIYATNINKAIAINATEYREALYRNVGRILGCDQTGEAIAEHLKLQDLLDPMSERVPTDTLEAIRTNGQGYHEVPDQI